MRAPLGRAAELARARHGGARSAGGHVHHARGGRPALRQLALPQRVRLQHRRLRAHAAARLRQPAPPPPVAPPAPPYLQARRASAGAQASRPARAGQRAAIGGRRRAGA